MCVVCACYFSPLSTSFVFHALNIIRFSYVAYVAMCDRAFMFLLCGADKLFKRVAVDGVTEIGCLSVSKFQDVNLKNLLVPKSKKVEVSRVVKKMTLVKYF